MAGSLEGPLAKWARAKGQSEELRKEIWGVFPTHKRWPVRTEADGSGLEYRFYLGELPDVDPEWALKLGEIMFNLRSALDHLAYELHLRHFRGALPNRIEGVTQFPIYMQPSEFGRNYYRIKDLSHRDRRALAHLQPYVTWRDQWFETRYWLSRLNALHNFDKHRKLHLVTASLIRTPWPHMDASLGFETHPSWGPVEPEAEVDRWTFAKAPPDLQPHHGVTLQVILEHGGEWVEVGRLTARILIAVNSVIERFANRFE